MSGYHFDDDHVIVQVSDRALMHMTLMTLESYTVRFINGDDKEGRTGLETFGLLWGHKVEMNGQTIYVVDEVTTDINADRNEGSVTPNQDSFLLKIDAVSAYWPEHVYLGDFHSHPYADIHEVKACEGWNFSRADYNSIDKHDDPIKFDMAISMVMAIGAMKRSGRKPPCYTNRGRTVEFTLQNYRLWLTAYAVRTVWHERDEMIETVAKLVWPRPAKTNIPNKYKDIPDISVEISVPRIMGFEQYAEFGRYMGPGQHKTPF